MRRLALLPAAALLAAGLAFTSPAPATVVEKVVAIVGDSPILLSELNHRSRPYLAKIYGSVPKPQQDFAIGEMRTELIKKMVEERLVALAADKLNVTVTSKEVDDAIKLKAADEKKSVAEVLKDSEKMGMSEQDYRDEVRRELLFGKMLETRVRGRVRPTEDDAREYFKRIQVQERRQQTWRGAVIVLDLPAGSKGEEARALADAIVKQARGGTDFAFLAKKYSTDALGREKGGDVGWRQPTGYGKVFDEAILRLDRGEISEPLIGTSTITIVKVVDREVSQIPEYGKVRDAIYGRVRDELLQKQIKLWLDELRQGVFIKVQL
jgi:peptidyl-prolyl cis-trans isomerase SurA